MNQQTAITESSTASESSPVGRFSNTDGRVATWFVRAVVAAILVVGLGLAVAGPAGASADVNEAPGGELSEVLDLRVLDPEVTAASGATADETIALSTSSALISLIGVLILASAIVAAAIAIEARSRDESDGELLGRA